MKIINKKAKRDYEILEKYEAGIVLTGAEVKSVKQGRIKLEDAFVRVKEDGVFLVNSFIAPYSFADNRDYDPRRERRLLLHKKEILRLITKMRGSRGLTVIPLSCYTKRGLIKFEIALARGRKKFEKQRVEKEREIKREIDREIKKYLR